MFCLESHGKSLHYLSSIKLCASLCVVEPRVKNVIQTFNRVILRDTQLQYICLRMLHIFWSDLPFAEYHETPKTFIMVGFITGVDVSLTKRILSCKVIVSR